MIGPPAGCDCHRLARAGGPIVQSAIPHELEHFRIAMLGVAHRVHTAPHHVRIERRQRDDTPARPPTPTSIAVDPMTDLLFVLITVVFFMICAAYARGLDRV